MCVSENPTVVQRLVDPNHKDKRRVILSDGRCIGPYHASTLLLCDIYEKCPITPEVEERLQREEALREAKECAMNYLAYSAHSCKEVHLYLIRKLGCTMEVASSAVAALAGMGLLDDGALGERIVQQIASSGVAASKKAVAQKLMRRGLNSNDTRRALESVPLDEFPAALRAARKKLVEIDRKAERIRIDHPDEDAYSARTHRHDLLAGYLGRKGYARETVKRVLDCLLDETADERM